MPRAQNDDCTQSFEHQRLSCIDPESSPSGGWRSVYAEMGVTTDANRQP